MQTDERSNERVAELRRAIAAGEYAPGADLVAGQLLATVGLIRRIRRRIEDLAESRFEPGVPPPTRRFRPEPEHCRPRTARH
jgi:hypothetical protein